jgi:hypothetical protein
VTRRLILAAAAALALAAPAGASPVVTLHVNDEFAVKNTHILCAVQISKTLVPGQKLIACFYATPKGPVAGSYTTALAVNGEVALAKIGADGKPKVVMTRKPAVVARHAADPKLYAVGLNTVLVVKGTAITCAVKKQLFAGRSATTVGCIKINAQKKARPGSYGFGITDGGAFLVHFDSKSRAVPIKIVQHGK